MPRQKCDSRLRTKKLLFPLKYAVVFIYSFFPLAFSSSLKLREKLSLGQTWFQYGGRWYDRQPCRRRRRRALLSTWWVLLVDQERWLILVAVSYVFISSRWLLDWPGPVTFVPKHFSFLVRTCGFLLRLKSKWCAACCERAEVAPPLLYFAFAFVGIIIDPYDLWLYLRPPTEWREKRETFFTQMVSTISDHVCDRQHWRRNLHKFP